ncbi:MAG: hypothetical protein RL308_3286 [Bacteroidota bacterium]
MLLIIALFFGCSEEDSSSSCIPITCLNGGTSTLDCGCNCPIGFTGSNCSTQVIPTQVKITKIRVKKFPNLKPNGSNWDTFVLPGYEKPDIFPVLFTFQGTVLFAGTPIKDSFSYGNDAFDFIPSTPIVITQLTQMYTLILYDDDVNNSFETMGGINFYIYSSTGGFPTTIPLNNPTSDYGFELTLSYVW